jgi:hypothetical protein
MSPLASTAIVFYFKGHDVSVFLAILAVIAILFSAYAFYLTCGVYLQQLEVSPLGIRSFTPFGTGALMEWGKINDAALRERRNPVTRTERLLILHSPYGMMTFPLSILSPKEEQEVIEEIKQRTRLVVIEDRPLI